MQDSQGSKGRAVAAVRVLVTYPDCILLAVFRLQSLHVKHCSIQDPAWRRNRDARGSSHLGSAVLPERARLPTQGDFSSLVNDCHGILTAREMGWPPG